MDLEGGSYRGRFKDLHGRLSRDLSLGTCLLEEVLQDLDDTKATLQQTRLDLDNESEARRRLQQEANENRKRLEQIGNRPFVVALIDTDGYVFKDTYITKGAKGGENAADALLLELRQHINTVLQDHDNMDVVVRAFANVSGLDEALQRQGKLKEVNLLRSFTSGFSNRKAFFDFVDVGSGKERADHKFRENVTFYLESFQCRHLVLGCAHESGYAPFLGQFAGDTRAAERVTLLEGNQFSADIRKLGLNTTQFKSVFTTTTRQAPSRNSSGGRNNQAQVSRLGPVIMDSDGHRRDRPLAVSDLAVGRIQRSSLCFYYYLGGECSSQICARNHIHRPLTDEEFDALWWLARQGRCFKNCKTDKVGAEMECSDEMCVYGYGKEA